MSYGVLKNKCILFTQALPAKVLIARLQAILQRCRNVSVGINKNTLIVFQTLP